MEALSRWVDNLEFVNSNLSQVDLYIQLAEEAAELSQAAAKMARHLKGSNPTRRNYSELEASVIEEMADTWLSFKVLYFGKDYHAKLTTTQVEKLDRWASRLKARYETEEVTPDADKLESKSTE